MGFRQGYARGHRQRSGAAARGALRELIEAYATELGHWPPVILTGGDARLVGGDPNESGLVQAIVPDLVLRRGGGVLSNAGQVIDDWIVG